ncbi:MAG: LUD domain-containing protein [Acidobacteriota bacterium]
MSARDRILQRLRNACRGTLPAPAPEVVPPASLGWDDFRRALEEAGGVMHGEVAMSGLVAALEEIAGGEPAYAHGAAALLGKTPAPVMGRDLDGVACLVATGSMAVARIGSVLVSEKEVPVRVQILLPETVVILVPAGALVDDLPALYTALGSTNLARGYFTFISGPSKTADIEQTLVTGAHGPRCLTVVPVPDMPKSH